MAENKRAFEEQLELENNSTGSFSDELNVYWNMLKPSQDSAMYSTSNFMDELTFILSFVMGFYTLFLLVQTARYVYYQTSIVDQHKRKMYNH